MDKLNALSSGLGEEKSRMDVKCFEEGQLLDLGEDEHDNEGNADDIELDGIDVTKWDKCNGLWLVLEEHRPEVLRQHHDSQVARHWWRHRSQELVSRNCTRAR